MHAENRARLLPEVTKAVTSFWGNGRVGVRLGPASHFDGMADSNPAATFGYVAGQFTGFDLAYEVVREHRFKGAKHRVPLVNGIKTED